MDVRLPNGTLIRGVPEGTTQSQLLSKLESKGYNVDRLLVSETQPIKEYAGFFGSFKDAITKLGLTDDAAAYAANPTGENRRNFLNKAESRYKTIGFGEGKNWEALKEAIGGSLGAIAAPIVGGVVGSAAGPLGGIGGFFSTGATQYGINALRRQAEGQQEAALKGEAIPEIQLGKAALASVGQAALDLPILGAIKYVTKGFPFAKKLLSETTKTSEKAAESIIDAYKKGTISRSGNVLKGAGAGVAFEVPQEIAQQVLERWQAGLSLSNDEAKEEYKQAAIGAAILGGGFGAVGGYSKYRSDKKLGEQLSDAADATAAADAAAAAAVTPTETTDEEQVAATPVDEEGVPVAATSTETTDTAAADAAAAATPTETTEDTSEILAAREFIADIDKGGKILKPKKARSIAEDLGLEIKKGTSAKNIVEEIRANLDKYDSATADAAAAAADASNVNAAAADVATTPVTPPVEAATTPVTPPVEAATTPVTPPVEAAVVPVTPTDIPPVDAAAPDIRNLALEAIKTTPTIKAISEATGLSQPKAAQIMRGFVSEGIVERENNKFKLVEPITPPVTPPDVNALETVTPAEDTVVGQNDAGEQLYERKDGSRYRMRLDRRDRPAGYPDFGGDLAPVETISASDVNANAAAEGVKLENEKRSTIVGPADSESGGTGTPVPLQRDLFSEGQGSPKPTGAGVASTVETPTGPNAGETKQSRTLKNKLGEGQAIGVDKDVAINTLNEVADGWTNRPNYNLVTTVDQLPEYLRPIIDPNQKAFYEPQTNTVHIITNNANSEADLRASIFHETLGHFGLSELFNTRLDEIMYNIYSTNPAMKALANAWLAKENNGESVANLDENTQKARAVEEVLAERSEAGVIKEASIRAAFNRVAAFVRKFLRAIGVKLNYSNNDVTQILRQAHGKVNAAPSNVLNRDNDIRYRSIAKGYQDVISKSFEAVTKAPPATQETLNKILTALSNVPEWLSKAKLATLSIYHIQELYEKYAPALSKLIKIIESMVVSSTELLKVFKTKSFNYRKILRDNPNQVKNFNSVVNNINFFQLAIFKLNEKTNSYEDILTPKKLLNDVNSGKIKLNTLSPQTRKLYEVATMYYNLPLNMQETVKNVFNDYRIYLDSLFKRTLDKVLNKLSPEAQRVLRQKLNKERLEFYAPLTREGKYKLTYELGKDNFSEQYTSEAARLASIKRIEKRGGKITGTSIIPDNNNDYNPKNVPLGFLSSLIDAVRDASKGIPNANLPEITKTIFDAYVDFMPNSALKADASSRTIFKNNSGVIQYGVLGANENVMDVYDVTIPKAIYKINNIEFITQLEEASREIKTQLNVYNADKLDNPIFKNLPLLSSKEINDIDEEIDKRLEFIKNPIYKNIFGANVYTIGKANYLFSIAGNISSALINTASLTSVFSSLGATYGYANTSAAMLKASKMFAAGLRDNKNKLTNSSTFGSDRFLANAERIEKNTSPASRTKDQKDIIEYANFYRKIIERNQVGTSAEQELNTAQNITIEGYEGISARVNGALSFMFKNTERFNREVSLLSGFMLARDSGKSFDEATDLAVLLNNRSNGAATAETGSRLYQTSLGRIALTFRQFGLNMLIDLAMTFNSAEVSKIFKNSSSDPKEQQLVRSIARRKILGIFATSYILAGAKGLPFFGAAEVLAAMLMGDDDEPYDLQQEVLDSLGAVGLDGPVNQILNLDIASRTGFNGLLWRDDPKRLAEVGALTYALEKVAGPTFGLYQNWARGAKEISEGNMDRAFEAFAPAAVRNVAKGFRYASEGALNRKGDPIVEDVNAYNLLMQIIGFSPADLARNQAQIGVAYKISEEIGNRRTALLTQLYAATQAGNSDLEENIREKIDKFNEANPSEAIDGKSETRSFKERQRRAAQTINGIYLPRKRREAVEQYMADENEDDSADDY